MSIQLAPFDFAFTNVVNKKQAAFSPIKRHLSLYFMLQFLIMNIKDIVVLKNWCQYKASLSVDTVPGQ